MVFFAVVIVAGVAVFAAMWVRVLSLRVVDTRATRVTTAPTTFYNLKVTSYRGYVDSRIPGGGLAQ